MRIILICVFLPLRGRPCQFTRRLFIDIQSFNKYRQTIPKICVIYIIFKETAISYNLRTSLLPRCKEINKQESDLSKEIYFSEYQISN